MFWMLKRKEGWTAVFPSGGEEDLEKLPARLRAVLEKGDLADRATARLFPPAYRDDPKAEEDYQHLLRDDLLRRKLEGVEAFERTFRARRHRKFLFGVKLVEIDLSDEDLSLWLGFLHDMRLVIGSALDITDETWERGIPDGPDAAEYALLHRLAVMEESILAALREAEDLHRFG